MKAIAVFICVIILGSSCSDTKQINNKHEIDQLRAELDSIKTTSTMNKRNQIATFLTFQKQDAEQAMNFYIDLFDNSEIIKIDRWGKEGPGKEGTVMHAIFELNGALFMCSDSPAIHDWDFTPAVSNFVQCGDEDELNRFFTKLSESGTVMMPLDNYGFSQKFGFVEDQFGVSWQLNLP